LDNRHIITQKRIKCPSLGQENMGFKRAYVLMFYNMSDAFSLKIIDLKIKLLALK
jgi:hypothetical protein